jgi:hypothetical protein
VTVKEAALTTAQETHKRDQAAWDAERSTLAQEVAGLNGIKATLQATLDETAKQLADT